MACVAAVLTAWGTAGALQVQTPDVRVVDGRETRGELGYEAQLGADCRIRWVVATRGVNVGVAQLRSECRLSADVQSQLHAAVLARLLAAHSEVRTLFWGGVGKWPEWSARLAVAAKHSSEWDATRGRPVGTQSPNAVVLRLLSRPDVLGELERIFDGSGVRARPTSVEKVMVGRASRIVTFRSALPPGVGTNDLVPFDALLWLALDRTRER